MAAAVGEPRLRCLVVQVDQPDVDLQRAARISAQQRRSSIASSMLDLLQSPALARLAWMRSRGGHGAECGLSMGGDHRRWLGCYNRWFMARARSRVWKLIGGTATIYVLVLVFGGVALEGCLEDRVREALGRALDAEVTVGDTSLSVWRGRVELQDVVARRVEGGAMELVVDTIEVDVAGWGAAVFDHDIDRAVVRGARMELSARGLTDLARRPRAERKPIPIGELVLENVSLGVQPTALLPGLGRMEAVVTAAAASDVVVSSGLSWMRGLSRLEGRVSAPGAFSLGMAYRTGSLTLTGGPLGAMPVTVPLRLPTLDETATELDYLRALATSVIRAAGARIPGKQALDSVRGVLQELMDRQ
jgi:hypothetical protein